MRMNLYVATCSLLAYAGLAINVTQMDDDLYAQNQQEYDYDYDLDLAETYGSPDCCCKDSGLEQKMLKAKLSQQLQSAKREESALKSLSAKIDQLESQKKAAPKCVKTEKRPKPQKPAKPQKQAKPQKPDNTAAKIAAAKIKANAALANKKTSKPTAKPKAEPKPAPAPAPAPARSVKVPVKKVDTKGVEAKARAAAAKAAAKAKADAAKAAAKGKADAAKLKAKQQAKPSDSCVEKKLEESKRENDALNKKIADIGSDTVKKTSEIIGKAKDTVARSQAAHAKAQAACNNGSSALAAGKQGSGAAGFPNIEQTQGFLSSITPQSKTNIAKAMATAMMSEKSTAKAANEGLAKAIDDAQKQ